MLLEFRTAVSIPAHRQVGGAKQGTGGRDDIIPSVEVKQNLKNKEIKFPAMFV